MRGKCASASPWAPRPGRSGIGRQRAYDFIPIDGLEGRALTNESGDDKNNLFLMDFRDADQAKCDFVRRCMTEVKVRVEYTDIYEKVNDVCESNTGRLHELDEPDYPVLNQNV